MNIAYENLDLIPKLLDLVIDLKNEIEVMKAYKPDLTKQKEVVSFLGISRQTLHNLVEKGDLKEGIHFSVNEKGHKEFNPESIIEFKKHYVKHAKKERKDTQLVNDIMSRFAA